MDYQSGVSRSDLRERVDQVRHAQGIVGSAPAFLAALDDLACFAAVDVPVFIAGETGTGKELVARSVHYLSARSAAPLVAVNCGALPERLFENELFGHDRGAFTDARQPQPGLIAQADGGTLLLDEIDCLDPHAQTALLRFLQDGRYRPLGAGRDRRSDVRIIASSNAQLERKVAEGRFRSDLMFRLDVARIDLPPLRERRIDILPLARRLLAKAAGRHRLTVPRIAPALEQRLLDHDWPGNVRELENVLHRALLLARGGELTVEAVRLGAATAPAGSETQFQGTLRSERNRRNKAFEREYLSWLLLRSNGNITKASHAAGTERRHLGRLIQRHGIDASDFRCKGPRSTQ